jgi:hypothetical protein
VVVVLVVTVFGGGFLGRALCFEPALALCLGLVVADIQLRFVD